MIPSWETFVLMTDQYLMLAVSDLMALQDAIFAASKSPISAI